MTLRRLTEYLVVHCSATPPEMDIGREEIDSWHRERGWSMIGYHYVIRRNGTIEPGRRGGFSGAHVKGYNTRSIGICMVGGVGIGTAKPENNFTDLQFATLRSLLTGLKQAYPDATIQGHRDFQDVYKACPSFDVTSWWNGDDIDRYTD